MVWQPDTPTPVARFTTLNVGEFRSSQLAGRAVNKDERRRLKDKEKVRHDFGVTDSQLERAKANFGDAAVLVDDETQYLMSHACGVDLTKWSSFQVRKCTVGYLSFGPIENVHYVFRDLSLCEKDWRSCARGAQAT